MHYAFTNKKFMNKFCTTLMAGIAIGLLIAPEKGSHTRRKITRGIQALRNRFSCAQEGESSFATLARDSGLSRNVSPDMADDV